MVILFNFVKNLRTVFCSGCIILHPPAEHEVPSVCTFSPVLVFCFLSSVLIDVKWLEAEIYSERAVCAHFPLLSL